MDATPLFVGLAGAYYERTDDLAFLKSLWPHILRALDWIDRYGDRDGDGLVEYARKSHTGLINQGWKDSEDSVFHTDGSLAQGPIALCEVQAYVYAEKRAAAGLAMALGDQDRAHALMKAADTLLVRWDHHPRARPARGQDFDLRGVLFRLGVRTVAEGNPMSYHNGSIWPHDNALIAAGFCALRLQGGGGTDSHGSSLFFDLHRLPELFCGFSRRQPSIRLPARRKRGPQQRCSSCSRVASGLRCRAPSSALCSQTPTCRRHCNASRSGTCLSRSVPRSGCYPPRGGRCEHQRHAPGGQSASRHPKVEAR